MDWLAVLCGVFVFALMAIIVWQFFALVGDMAKDRGHSPWPWWILAVMWSPFGSVIILWAFFDLVEDNDEERAPL
ncbi:hypothetical protein [Rhodovulum sp. MB263]|uniref:hypothetical protein n=1 Tax=Rhodovulum sp. (strain MB263) TaxID=308754 RepID=UPI0012DB374D|nr:hypothetical protein [Rhodovulum sp. MB263]